MKTVAFLARWPGYLVLKDLLQNPKINLMGVYSHGLEPRSTARRPEAYLFEEACKDRCPLNWEKDLFNEDLFPECDLILALSWRHLIPQSTLDRAKYAINIHRGELPKYAGAKPVERALINREPRVAITAHHMTEKIDEGEIIASVYSDIPEVQHTYSVAEHAEVVKEYLYPLYVPLVRTAIESISRIKPQPTWDGAVM